MQTRSTYKDLKSEVRLGSNVLKNVVNLFNTFVLVLGQSCFENRVSTFAIYFVPINFQRP